MTNTIRVEQSGRRPLDVIVSGTLEIGRECDGLVLADERVSRRHLRIDHRDGRLLVTDLGSSNGTMLDGDPIDAQVALLPGGIITLGDTTITISPMTATGGSSERKTSIVGATSVRSPQKTSIERVADVVEEAAVSLAGSVENDRTVTIMFSDIESSTEKAVAMGDLAWMDVLKVHTSIFENRVGEHGGSIIKNQGDGYMITFNSARRAVLCSAAIQNDLVDHATAHPDQAIRVRMGCHTGEAIHDAGDLFGRHVIIAARVANLAAGGQVLVSSIVREITAARGDLSFAEPESVELKGVDGVHEVFDFDWKQAPLG